MNSHLLQQAVKALTAVRFDKSFCCLKEERTQAIVLKALASLEAAIQQQPEAQSVARIADIEQQYPWRISLVWHVAVPDLAKFGIVQDALLYTAPPALQQQEVPAMYISGPYPDGCYSICELVSGRVLQRITANEFPAALRQEGKGERIEIGELLLPGINGEEYDEPETIMSSKVLEGLQARLVHNSRDRILDMFVEIGAPSPSTAVQQEAGSDVPEALIAYMESQKFHPSASHVPPDYRDGFNHALTVVLDRIALEKELFAAAPTQQPPSAPLPADCWLTDEEWRTLEESGNPFLRCGCGASMPCSEHFKRGAHPSVSDGGKENDRG